MFRHRSCICLLELYTPSHIPEAAHCQELKCGPLSKFLLMVVPPKEAELRACLLAPVGFARKRLLWWNGARNACHMGKPRVSCALHSQCFIYSQAQHSAVIGNSSHNFCYHWNSHCSNSSVTLCYLSASVPLLQCFVWQKSLQSKKDQLHTHTYADMYIHMHLESHRICV